MTRNSNIAMLNAELLKQREVLKRIEAYIDDFAGRHADFSRLDTDAALAISQAFCNYYTCLETLFLRISQFFENNPRPSAWHRDLLDKMRLDVPDLRQRVVSDASHRLLLEFLKFRHFCRYYFEFDYDRDKLQLQMKRFMELKPMLGEDMERFFDFIRQLQNVKD